MLQIRTAYAKGSNSSRYIPRSGQQHVHDPVRLLTPKEYESVFQSFQSDRLRFRANPDIHTEYGVAKRRFLAKNHERRMLNKLLCFPESIAKSRIGLQNARGIRQSGERQRRGRQRRDRHSRNPRRKDISGLWKTSSRWGRQTDGLLSLAKGRDVRVTRGIPEEMISLDSGRLCSCWGRQTDVVLSLAKGREERGT